MGSHVDTVDLVEYLFARLHQLGIRSIHGVPGDFNLTALDYLDAAGLRWVGNCNELNAAYAADAYARINGVSALVTTYGVGELSAINAIAGAYAEHIPIVHIVGQPSTPSQQAKLLLHHTLGDGDYDIFADMSAKVSCAVARITDASRAASQIDSVLEECWKQSRPVYIGLPTDLVKAQLDASRLSKTLDLTLPENDQETEAAMVDSVLESLRRAKDPVVLVDGCVFRYRALDEVHDVISALQIPVYVAPMGKGAVDEALPIFGGVYSGMTADEAVRSRIESSDLVLVFGPIKSDLNTSGFSTRLRRENCIEFHKDSVQVRHSVFPELRLKNALKALHVALSQHQDLIQTSRPVAKRPEYPSSKGTAITHDWVWARLSSWFQNGDVIIGETGTSTFGVWEMRLPKAATVVCQALWCSIGYSVGACQGAALAVKDSKLNTRRTVLFVGDGSFQVTAQEVSTMIRHNLHPIIFVVCNDGYTIERFVHGPEASYNDIQPWRYKEIMTLVGAEPDQYQVHSVQTRDQLEALIADSDFSHPTRLQFVELHMPRDDAPVALQAMAKAAASRNA
ncbi:Pyruvate decarboxylase 1 [Monascus purpureus]|uniref:Pyruvate decarboxylase n=1 Tax=Monascus purpureus TaxID=5098 RepID=A0A507QWT8_MONPU|nr:Pyruvate decarboxylase 1 [Monascus purpureus]BDD57641.1 hypothetical protein MAP00_002988 [Monascus purpureus]